MPRIWSSDSPSTPSLASQSGRRGRSCFAALCSCLRSPQAGPQQPGPPRRPAAGPNHPAEEIATDVAYSPSKVERRPLMPRPGVTLVVVAATITMLREPVRALALLGLGLAVLGFAGRRSRAG